MKPLQGLCKLSRGIQYALDALAVEHVRFDAGVRKTDNETSVFLSLDAEGDPNDPKNKRIQPA